MIHFRTLSNITVGKHMHLNASPYDPPNLREGIPEPRSSNNPCTLLGMVINKQKSYSHCNIITSVDILMKIYLNFKQVTGPKVESNKNK